MGNQNESEAANGITAGFPSTGKTLHAFAFLDTIKQSGNLDLHVGCSTARAVLACLEDNPFAASSVRNVVVQHSNRADCGPSSSQEFASLLATLARILPRLETLRVTLDITGNRHSPLITLPITALAAFFQQAPQHLVSLKLSAVISAEAEKDFELLEEAIRLNAPASFKEVRLEFCEPAPGTASLDPLLKALSSCSKLQQVTLSGTNVTDSSRCTGPSLVKLVNETDLKVLTIWGGKRLLGQEDILSLVEALETNTSLTELTIHARGLGPAIGQALARCLKMNTTLERLILSVSDNCQASRFGIPVSDYVATTTLLAEALRLKNRTLRMLSLDYSMEDEDIVSFGDSLDYDFYDYVMIDSRASLWRANIQAVTKAFTRMLHSNPVLEVLWMNLDNEEEDDDEDEARNLGPLTSEMEMLLRLNRFGIRRGLFESEPEATGQEWIKALASQNHDLNALYYLLSKNPSLCCSTVSKGNKRVACDGEAIAYRASKRSKTTK